VTPEVTVMQFGIDGTECGSLRNSKLELVQREV